MHRLKVIIISGLIAFLTNSCEGPEPVKLGPKQDWKKEEYLTSKQIVFTNEYRFKDGRYALGASSFLVKAKNQTVLCTAKHLLSEAMGISPKVATSDFNAQLDYWKVFAKNDKIFGDTLSVSRMITQKSEPSDIILLKCKSTTGSGLLTLTPRLTRVGADEELEIIGYEFGDASGDQKSFKVTFDEYDRSTIIVKAKKPFRANGMSGSPVVDASGYVVGVLVGGGMFDGSMYLSVEPLKKIKQYFR